MAPSKKRDKEVSIPVQSMSSSNIHNGSCVGTLASTTTDPTESVKLNGHQQEQELFLQAFEKPTQIYRYLRNRHETSPIFLNRTLSYMKERMSRSSKMRFDFKVNNILETITQKSEFVTHNYLHIIFDGLHEKIEKKQEDSPTSFWQSGDIVSVDSTLYKITRSKRKDSTLDFQEIINNSSNVIYNPNDNISEYATMTIPVQSMQLGEQHTLYKILFRIKLLLREQENSENEETPNKRSKSLSKIFGCELIIYEKSSGFITEGEYEAALQPLNSSSIKSFSPKKRTWETLPENYIPLSMKFDVFQESPKLKFRLILSHDELPPIIAATEMHKIVKYAHMVSVDKKKHQRIMGGDVNYNNNNCIKNENMVVGSVVKTPTEQIQIIYNFMYSNNTRQQTEYTQEVICPWCNLDCLRLYALLKHLKLCHARFNFTYQPTGNGGARIDVTINDAYDGSYSGSPYDLAGPSGSSFARTCGPVRRTTVTNLLVCRPRRQKTCLDEFLVLDEDELSNQRSYITGHNRLYHHTETCLPVHPKELDIDSEGESDPLWLRQKTIQMIDEFSDVNEGEKELMKLWNLHVMKHGYVGDCQLPLACEMFLNVNGHEIIRKNLYRNFILHMSSLFDYGLLSSETVYKTVQKLQGMLSRYSEGQLLMSKEREIQLKYWVDIGIHKQDEQKLKSPLKPQTFAIATTSNNTTITSSLAASKHVQDKAMQPPKRTPTAIKRVNANSSNADKPSNGSNGSGKGVAKKSAERISGDNLIITSTRERRSTEKSLKRTNSLERNDPQTRRSSSDNYKGQQTAKRRLSAKDAAQQPVTKRNRFDISSNNFNNTASKNINTNTSSNNTATRHVHKNPTTPTKALPTSKRLISRRRSFSEPAAIISSTTSNNKTTVNGKTKHTLRRTRLSIPLTKIDKR